MIYPLFKIESGTYCEKTVSHMKVKFTVVLYSGYEINDLKTHLRTLEELLSFNVFAFLPLPAHISFFPCVVVQSPSS